MQSTQTPEPNRTSPPRFLVSLLCYAVIFAGVGYYAWKVLVPAFWSPSSRMYASAAGYPSVQRIMHQPIEVEAVKPRHMDLTHTVAAEGYVTFLNEHPVKSEVQGIVTAIRVDQGQSVHRGDLLFRVSTGEHLTRLDELNLALKRADVDQAKVNLARQEALLKQKAASVRDVEYARLQLEHSKIGLDLATENYNTSLLSRSKLVVDGGVRQLPGRGQHEIDFVSMIDGTVFQRNVQVGENLEAIQTQKVLMMIGDELVFEANFDQRYASTLRHGQHGKFYLRAYPGKAFEATIVRMAAEVMAENQVSPGPADSPSVVLSKQPPNTFAVWLKVANADPEHFKLLRGMNGYCIFEEKGSGLAVPDSSLMRYSGRQGTVLAVNPSNQIEVRQVTYSAASDGLVEIEQGVSANDWVVLHGQVALKPGDTVVLHSKESEAQQTRHPAKRDGT